MTATGSRGQLRFIPAGDVEAFGYPRAAAALEVALRDGLDPSADPARSSIAVDGGASLLYMPSITATGIGVKLVTHNPRNAETADPLVHGVYVLFDRDTLAPVALLDGAALTTLRTPAVSVVAVRQALRRFQRPLNVVIFGLGPQGIGHLDALRDIATHDGDIYPPATVTYVARRTHDDRLPRRAGVAVTGVIAGSAEMIEALIAANVVVCATSAQTPLFDSSVLSDQVVVIAVGSHSPDAREIDGPWCGRSLVIVEDVATAMRECGEVVQACGAGVLTSNNIVSMAEVVTGRVGHDIQAGPTLFKGSGMAWQDLVVAQSIASTV